MKRKHYQKSPLELGAEGFIGLVLLRRWLRTDAGFAALQYGVAAALCGIAAIALVLVLTLD